LLEAMRALALDYLIKELNGSVIDDAEAEEWYKQLRISEPRKLFPYLVEDSGRVNKVFILEPESEECVRMVVQEIVGKGEGCTSDQLPFIKPSGSQSAQIGPVIKRTNAGNGGPSVKIINTTMKSFKEIAISGKPWSGYFSEIISILEKPKLKLTDGTTIEWRKKGYSSMLSCAIEKIGQQSETVFLTVRDYQSRLPGSVPQYLEYLMVEKLAGDRYVVGSARAQDNAKCLLCGVSNITVYPNALKGAGINLINIDRAGRFPGIDEIYAWKAFALCQGCADLLYVYKNHVLKKTGPKKDRQPFSSRIAGAMALVIPHYLPGLDSKAKHRINRRLQGYFNSLETDVEIPEDLLLETLKDQEGLLNLDILWATVGQNIDDVTGVLQHILPSRLRELSIINADFLKWQSPLYPKVIIEEMQPDLTLRAMKPLFHRPSGKKTEALNQARSTIELKRLIAYCLYHKQPIPKQRLEEEWLITARSYYNEAMEKAEGYKGLLYEGQGKKGPYLTAAGWIKYFTWWLYYFQEVGVLGGSKTTYKPGMDELAPYFGPESRIDSEEKAFAFMLGILYGKLMEVQGARGVNVSANALTWLKRLTLKGKDLPELYIKIRSKLLAYEAEKSAKVRELVAEIGNLGVRLGDQITLDEISTNYYLLLGQSVARDVLKSKTREEEL
jgi:CRISPR-associated protein Csh1